MMIKKYNEFIREFVETGSDSVLDAKMQEIKELVDSIGGQAFMYEWENKNDHELFVNFTSNELVLRYEFDIDDLILKKIASNVVDFETKVNSIDEGLDIIEKDIHSILGVSESFDNEDELDEDLILSLMKDKGWGDLSYDRIEDFKDSDYYKAWIIDENDFVEQFDLFLHDDVMDDEYLNNKSGEGRDIYDDDFEEEESNIDLSIELENKLRSLNDDSELTIDDFLEEFGVDLNNMTGFAWASILKNAEKYKDMSDEEFKKEYDQYKNSITENNSMRYLKNFKESYQGRWSESLNSQDVKQIYPMVKRILEIYPGESADSEGIVEELERKLSSYDDKVREYIIDTLMFGNPDISLDELERDVIQLGDDIIYDMGTEAKMVIRAFEAAFEVIGKHFYLVESKYEENILLIIEAGEGNAFIKNRSVNLEINRKLMNILNKEFDLKFTELTEKHKIENSKVSEIVSFLTKIGLRKEEFKSVNRIKMVFTGKLTLKDIKKLKK